MTPERRKKRDDAAMHKIVGQEWTIFYHDEARRCKTFPELIAAARQFKTRLVAKLQGMQCEDWIENTKAFIDLKIEELIALSEKTGAGQTPPAETPPTKPAKFWLPKSWRAKAPKTPPPEPDGPKSFPA